MKINKKLKTNAILNVIKQLASIIFPMITFPYISRVLGVEQYGKVNFTASIIGYISLIAGLGIQNYAIREGSRLKHDIRKLNIFVKEIFSLNCISMALAYLILLVILFYYKSVESYRILLVIQAVTIFFSVVGCDWLNVIYEDFLYITVRYIGLQIIAAASMFILVKSPDDMYAYTLISQIPIILANVLNLLYFKKKLNVNIKFVWDKHIFSHLKYVLILFGNAVSMLIYVNSDITILGIYISDSEVGIYSVSVKIYNIVKQLLNAIMIVAIPRMARWTKTKDAKIVHEQLDEILGMLLVVLIPTILGLTLLSNQIIMIVAGDAYISANASLKILSITLFFSTGVCFYSNLVLIPNNMEKYILRSTFVSAVLNIVLNVWLIPVWGVLAAATTTFLSEFVTVLQLIIVVKSKYFPKVEKHFCFSLILGVLVGSICMICTNMIEGYVINVVVSIILSGMVLMGCYLLYSKRH